MVSQFFYDSLMNSHFIDHMIENILNNMYDFKNGVPFQKFRNIRNNLKFPYIN